MMPPDYLSYMQDPNLLDIMLLVVKFYAMMIVFMFMNVVCMVGFVWNLLFICRFLGIPWIDGTTKGFIKRYK